MKVEIYGTEWCAYCKQAVSLCRGKGIVFEYIDLDKTENLRILEERLKSRIKSVPQIFVDGKHLLNGYNELQQELAKD